MLLRKGQQMFEDATAGVHPGVISQFEDAGIAETKFGPKAQVRIVYVLAETDSAGRQKRIRKHYTATLHEKSNLGKLLFALTGKFPDELDSSTLIGKQVLLTFGTVVKDGVTKVRLYGVENAPAGQAVLIPGIAGVGIPQAAQPDVEKP